MGTRRKNHEGSWGKRKINGILYDTFSEQTGDKKKIIYGRTMQRLKENVREYKEKEFVPDSQKITLGEYLMNWLETEKKNVLSPGTYDGYERAIRVRLLDFKDYRLSDKQLYQLNKNPKESIRIFSEYVEALRKHGYALKTIKEITTIISQCLDYALNPIREEIAYNYMSMVSLPKEEHVKTKKKEIHFMNEDEFEILYNEARSVNGKGSCNGGTGIGKPKYSNNGYAIILMMYTGLRVGELCGLKWIDIDWVKHTIHIRRSLRLVQTRTPDGPKTEYIEKETKTKNGNRILPFKEGRRIEEALKYFLQFKERETDYVCINKNHHHMCKERLWRSLTQMEKNCGLPHYYLHELRHSFGSLCLQKCGNKEQTIASISRILGHANISITYNIYIHVFDEQLTTTAQLLDNTTVQSEIDWEKCEKPDDSEDEQYKELYFALKNKVQNLLAV